MQQINTTALKALILLNENCCYERKKHTQRRHGSGSSYRATLVGTIHVYIVIMKLVTAFNF